MKIKNINSYMDDDFYPIKEKIKRKKPRKKDLDSPEKVSINKRTKRK